MGALAKDSTLQSMLESMAGSTPIRTASVKEIKFNESQFENGQIDTSTGQNKSGSGFLRTSGFIELPQNAWKAQLFADKPWLVRILYYDSEKVYQEYGDSKTGYAKIKNYPYCRLFFYGETSYLSNADFITTRLKIQYIKNAPSENEYFLHNHLFNGNFEFDRNNDNVADGWLLKNTPSSSSVSDNIQSVTPASANYFIQMDSDSRLGTHKIYVAFSAYTPYDDCYLSVFGTNAEVAQNTQFTRISTIITATNSNVNPRISCKANAVEHEIQIKNVMMIDLTDIYGDGNEPTLSQIDEIVDKFYGGYVPCEYSVKYDDSNLPVDVLTRLKNIDTGFDEITFENGMVSSVNHYVGEMLKSTVNVNRDKFGNIISIEEVQK